MIRATRARGYMSNAGARETRYVASPDQVSTTVGGQAVILGMRDGVYFGLNAVGAHVWAMLTEPRTAAELAAAVAREFAVEPERCASDVASLLEELRRRELVQVVEVDREHPGSSIGR